MLKAVPVGSAGSLVGDHAESHHLHHEFGHAYYRLSQYNCTVGSEHTVRLSWTNPVLPLVDPRYTYIVETLGVGGWTKLVKTRASEDEGPLVLASVLLGYADGMVAMPYNWTPVTYICPCCANECRADRYALDVDTGGDDLEDIDTVECFDNCIACAQGPDDPKPAGEFTGRVFVGDSRGGDIVQGRVD